MPETIEQKYGLSQPNFILDPVADAEFYAKRQKIDWLGIVESLRVDLVTEVAPKRLYWGPYGGGKTHTLTKTMKELEKMTSIHYIRVECPDMPRKATFSDLYREGIMRQMGQTFVLDLLDELLDFIGTVKPKELNEQLKGYLVDEDFVNAVSSLRRPNPNKTLFWAWLSGVPVSRSDLSSLSQTQDLTSAEAARLADIIVALGRILNLLRKQTLILILDEMERLRPVGPETVITFQTAFTRLLDPHQISLSVLIGASAKDQTDMPDVFNTGAVRSRLGADNMVSIPPMIPGEVDQFIREILAHFRDPQSNLDGLVANAKPQTQETLLNDIFPFTSEALDKLKGKLSPDITPREILLGMTKALGRAFLANQPLIARQSV